MAATPPDIQADLAAALDDPVALDQDVGLDCRIDKRRTGAAGLLHPFQRGKAGLAGGNVKAARLGRPAIEQDVGRLGNALDGKDDVPRSAERDPNRLVEMLTPHGAISAEAEAERDSIRDTMIGIC